MLAVCLEWFMNFHVILAKEQANLYIIPVLVYELPKWAPEKQIKNNTTMKHINEEEDRKIVKYKPEMNIHMGRICLSNGYFWPLNTKRDRKGIFII